MRSKEFSAHFSGVMHRLGIPSSLLGYRYIESAVSIMLSYGSLSGRMTTYLYPTVAQRHTTTPARVERAIRHAVTVSMERGDVGFITAVFGYTVSSTKGRLTNSEFITMLTEYLQNSAVTA